MQLQDLLRCIEAAGGRESALSLAETYCFDDRLDTMHNSNPILCLDRHNHSLVTPSELRQASI